MIRFRMHFQNMMMSITNFIFARLRELIGVFLILFSCYVTLALLYYNPLDPSWNHATGADITNELGYVGAIISDVLMQIMGLGIFVLMPAILTLGWRYIRHQFISYPILRFVAWLLSGLCVSVAIALWFPPLVLDVPPLGGMFGQYVRHYFVSLPFMMSFGDPILGQVYLSLMLGFIGIVNALFSTGLFKITIKTCVSILLYIMRFFVRLFVRNEPIVESKPKKSRPKIPVQKREKKKPQSIRLSDSNRNHHLPPLNLLTQTSHVTTKKIDQEMLEKNARLLETVLQDFGVKGKIINVWAGPVVTLYELEPIAGTRASRVVGLADDIARSMRAVSCRVATIVGNNVIGIELPNTERETVYLYDLLSSPEFETTSMPLTMALGKDIGGKPVLSDLAKMPHLLVAGTTGSGKSVGINTMLLSILYRLSPDECKLIMIDPKMLELSVYDGIPHLLSPVITDSKKAVISLKWAVQEMENRYRKMSNIGVRNIENYNNYMIEALEKGQKLSRRVQTGFDQETGEAIFEDQEIKAEKLPFIVIVIDEMADLMLVAGKDIEGVVQRLAQMARAAGVHLIMATQRPSVDVITGTIKANFPSRISFQVTSKIDSRTILSEMGAEQLLGRGDMLFMRGGGRIQRIHGPFVSDEEVTQVVAFLKQQGQPEYIESVTEGIQEKESEDVVGTTKDTLYDEAVAIVTRDHRVSTSYIQRRLQIGYNRAARLIEQMEENGVISLPNRSGKREILVDKHS